MCIDAIFETLEKKQHEDGMLSNKQKIEICCCRVEISLAVIETKYCNEKSPESQDRRLLQTKCQNIAWGLFLCQYSCVNPYHGCY